MQFKGTVLKEETRVADGVEYVTVTLLEDSPTPLLQMVDYSLSLEERVHKGKLMGKKITIEVHNFRSIFAGRPQATGKLLEIPNGK